MDSKEKNIEGLKMEYAAIREEIILLMNEHNTHRGNNILVDSAELPIAIQKGSFARGEM